MGLNIRAEFTQSGLWRLQDLARAVRDSASLDSLDHEIDYRSRDVVVGHCAGVMRPVRLAVVSCRPRVRSD